VRRTCDCRPPAGSLAPRATTKVAGRPGRALLADVREMILQARAGVARAMDSGLAMHYWNVGRRIRQDILKETRAGYGTRIVYSLSA
jgi:hypothetical protein